MREASRGRRWKAPRVNPCHARFHDRRGTLVYGAARRTTACDGPRHAARARQGCQRFVRSLIARASRHGRKPRLSQRTNGPKRIVERGRRKTASCRRREPPDPRMRTAEQSVGATSLEHGSAGAGSFGESTGWQKSVGRILIEAEIAFDLACSEPVRALTRRPWKKRQKGVPGACANLQTRSAPFPGRSEMGEFTIRRRRLGSFAANAPYRARQRRSWPSG